VTCDDGDGDGWSPSVDSGPLVAVATGVEPADGAAFEEAAAVGEGELPADSDGPAVAAGSAEQPVNKATHSNVVAERMVLPVRIACSP
jgi:hypothetical protein